MGEVGVVCKGFMWWSQVGRPGCNIDCLLGSAYIYEQAHAENVLRRCCVGRVLKRFSK